MSVTPFLAQSSYSDFFMAREAPVMSACPVPMPWQKIFMPPPVPVDSTTGAFMPLALENSSAARSEEHTSELQSLMRISYAVFCLQKKTTTKSKQCTTNANPTAQQITINKTETIPTQTP